MLVTIFSRCFILVLQRKCQKSSKASTVFIVYGWTSTPRKTDEVKIWSLKHHSLKSIFSSFCVSSFGQKKTAVGKILLAEVKFKSPTIFINRFDTQIFWSLPGSAPYLIAKMSPSSGQVYNPFQICQGYNDGIYYSWASKTGHPYLTESFGKINLTQCIQTTIHRIRSRVIPVDGTSCLIQMHIIIQEAAIQYYYPNFG